MKIGILSDAHGNIYAFEKVWKQLQLEKCDLYFFLGDVCGYYYHQNEIIDVLRSTNNMISILGNHDVQFLEMLTNGKIRHEYMMKYGKSCDLLVETISKENLNYLKTLPDKYFLEQYQTAFFHGSPWNYLDEYIYPSDSLERFTSFQYKYIFLGHTHYSMIRKVCGTNIVNPGACGQPRDGNWPSFAVINYEQESVEIKFVEYDRQLLINEVVNNKEENPYLIQILERINI